MSRIKDVTDGYDAAFSDDKSQKGLTKREYFAALAMQGILSGTSGVEALSSVHPANYAVSAVESADALIEALNKESGK